MISGTTPHILLKRIVAYLFTILIMSTIFCFSAQPANKSSHTSTGITKKIVTIFTKNKNLSQAQQNELVKKWNQRLRKIAHFCLYMSLGMSAFISFTLTFIKKGSHFIQKDALISFIFCVLYAICDEIHQTFVSGRSGEIRDVFIDSFGSTAGILTVMAIIYFYTKKRGCKYTI